MAWNHACLCMLSQEAFYQQRHNQHVILFFIHVRTSISVWTLIFREFIHFHLPRFKMRTTPGHTGISISQLHGISTRSLSEHCWRGNLLAGIFRGKWAPLVSLPSSRHYGFITYKFFKNILLSKGLMTTMYTTKINFHINKLYGILLSL